jgi:GNAT superfamily N-acetyltransferase
MHWTGRLAEIFQDWFFLMRRDGRGAALSAVRRELIRLPYRHLIFTVVARTLPEPLPDLQPKIALEIRDFLESDVDLVKQINRPSEACLCARRLTYGHKGLVALHNGQIAGYAWGASTIEPELERVRLALTPGDVLCIDAFTVPTFRGKGVQTALTAARFRLFGALGYQRAVAYIESNNHPSLAVWKKFDSEVTGRVDFLRIGPWRRTRYLPAG